MDYISKLHHGKVPWRFSRLRGFIENSSWHNMESVYNHTNRVLEAFDRISPYVRSISPIIQSAILFHDIGKIKPRFEGNKITYPKHEEIGAKIFYDYCKPKVPINLDLNHQYIKREDGLEFIGISPESTYEIILHHGELHEIMKSRGYLSEWKGLQGKIRERLSKTQHENRSNGVMNEVRKGLACLGYCDIIASDFLENNLIEASKRITRYDRILNDVINESDWS